MADGFDICDNCGLIECAHGFQSNGDQQNPNACLCFVRKEPPAGPFPLDVVDRFDEAFGLLADGKLSPLAASKRALSVIADYLRSEEARELIMQALWEELRETTHGECGRAADAVIAALLGEKG